MGECEHNFELSAYLDGELDAARRDVLEAHLRDCAACAHELRQLRVMSGFFAAGEKPYLPMAALRRFHDVVNEIDEEQEQADRIARRVLRISRVLTGIAASVLVAGSLWLVQLHQHAANQEQVVQRTELPGTDPTWEPSVIPVAVENPPVTPPDAASPADDGARWMVGGLVASGTDGE